MKTTALLTTSIGNYPKRAGKVRDLYDLGDSLLIVATDRISAFDVVMPNGIPDKGRVLTQISLFWFELLKEVVGHHVLSGAMKDLPDDLRSEEIDGRFMLCRKADVVPVECVVRGYLAGSGWREYKNSGTVCGIELPEGLKQSSELPEPIFTPTTKAEQGHDEPMTFQQVVDQVGRETADRLRDVSLQLYRSGRDYARDRGILLADTKFEFGRSEDGELMLIDEALTPDSSRFWPADAFKPGRSQPSFDKQFVRDYLDEIDFNRQPPAPVLPAEVVDKTRRKYIDAYTRLTGQKFPWA
jgi:phosphoribosylaminoimidazole-succinocarboxamide synthase